MMTFFQRQAIGKAVGALDELNGTLFDTTTAEFPRRDETMADVVKLMRTLAPLLVPGAQ